VQVEKYVQAMERAAALSPFDKDLALAAERARLELEKLQGSADLLGEKFDEIFVDSMGDAFTSIIDGSKSVSDAIDDMSKSIFKEMNNLIMKDLSKQLYKSLFGGGEGSGASSIGGYLSRLFGGGGGGGFHGGSDAANASNAGSGSSASGWASAISAVAGWFGSSFAIGTDYVPRDMIAKIHQGEKIIPRGVNESQMAGAARVVNVGGIHINGVQDYAGFQRQRNLIEAEVYGVAQRSFGRFT